MEFLGMNSQELPIKEDVTCEAYIFLVKNYIFYRSGYSSNKSTPSGGSLKKASSAKRDILSQCAGVGWVWKNIQGCLDVG